MRSPPAPPPLQSTKQYFGFGRTALRSALLAAPQGQGARAAGGAAAATKRAPPNAAAAAANKIDDAAMIELLFASHSAKQE
jgi:hypothetical protein